MKTFILREGLPAIIPTMKSSGNAKLEGLSARAIFTLWDNSDDYKEKGHKHTTLVAPGTDRFSARSFKLPDELEEFTEGCLNNYRESGGLGAMWDTEDPDVVCRIIVERNGEIINSFKTDTIIGIKKILDQPIFTGTNVKTISDSSNKIGASSYNIYVEGETKKRKIPRIDIVTNGQPDEQDELITNDTYKGIMRKLRTLHNKIRKEDNASEWDIEYVVVYTELLIDGKVEGKWEGTMSLLPMESRYDHIYKAYNPIKYLNSTWSKLKSSGVISDKKASSEEIDLDSLNLDFDF
jgi:hypothetical protein